MDPRERHAFFVDRQEIFKPPQWSDVISWITPEDLCSWAMMRDPLLVEAEALVVLFGGRPENWGERPLSGGLTPLEHVFISHGNSELFQFLLFALPREAVRIKTLLLLLEANHPWIDTAWDPLVSAALTHCRIQHDTRQLMRNPIGTVIDRLPGCDELIGRTNAITVAAENGVEDSLVLDILAKTSMEGLWLPSGLKFRVNNPYEMRLPVCLRLMGLADGVPHRLSLCRRMVEKLPPPGAIAVADVDRLLLTIANSVCSLKQSAVKGYMMVLYRILDSSTRFVAVNGLRKARADVREAIIGFMVQPDGKNELYITDLERRYVCLCDALEVKPRVNEFSWLI